MRPTKKACKCRPFSYPPHFSYTSPGNSPIPSTPRALTSVTNPFAGMGLKELLEAMPIEELELERSKETGRDIEL
jgi:hypothetical protein